MGIKSAFKELREIFLKLCAFSVYAKSTVREAVEWNKLAGHIWPAGRVLKLMA